MLMLRWSSLLADVGIESTPAGCASVLSSDATAAAVACASIRPDCSLPSRVRNAGSPLHRERRADAGGVAAHQIALQRRERGRRDLHFRERPEAGVDAVHGLVAARLAIDDDSRRADARARDGREGHRLAAVGNRDELFHGQRRAVQEDHRVES